MTKRNSDLIDREAHLAHLQIAEPWAHPWVQGTGWVPGEKPSLGGAGP